MGANEVDLLERLYRLQCPVADDAISEIRRLREALAEANAASRRFLRELERMADQEIVVRPVAHRSSA